MQITVKKDENGYLAEVENRENIFAYGESIEEAKQELLYVIEMMKNYDQK